MPEIPFEKSFYFEEKNKMKYPEDVIADKTEAAELDAKLSRAEIIEIRHLCQEKGYGNMADFLKEQVNKAGFKTMAISPFSVNFNTIPRFKNSTCFIPSAYVPRLKNLHKILPNMAKDGTESVITHEREHGRADALTSYDNKFGQNKGGEMKIFDLESLANLQKINTLVKNRANNSADKYFTIPLAAKEFAYLEILKEGAEALEIENMEKTAMGYFKHSYLFEEDEALLEKYGENADYLKEFIEAKRNNKTTEFYNMFLEEFRKVKKEVSTKYNQYIRENNISDFYGQEDRECEDLRVKIIEHLNRKKII